MTADQMPSDAEVEALISAAVVAAASTDLGREWVRHRDTAYTLRALLDARRSADARVAAAVMQEREDIAKEIERVSKEGPALIQELDIERSAGNGAIAMLLVLARTIRAFPAPDHADTLAAMLAEAERRGAERMREMAAAAAIYVGDNNREDMEARRIRDRIRALPVETAHE